VFNAQIEYDAWMFSQNKHRGQFDDANYPYFNHVAQVVAILRNVTKDSNIIAAAYLHDTIEDCGVTYEELCSKFNKTIADLVMEVTHDGAKDSGGYYFPRLHSEAGVLIKFADRLSNLSRMEPWPPERREHYVKKSKFWNSAPVTKKKPK
jgi:(p)ppGpp synthase/HD superfamily hydrolase